ncbi:MAG TPA: HAD family hydrolase [Vicinamibacterales bacterium]|jgi:D-glycero-D-manno-heptose 1,7-bisphosphate phosphatase
MKPAVFLDRDGTLIEEGGYLDRVERMVVFPWSVDAVRLLNQAGFAVVVVTNQAGVARGFFDEARVAEIHRHLDERMHAGGARIEAFYYCPHHPDASVEAYRQACECRKPRPGMLRAAAADHDLDLSRSFVVGDRWLDVRLAHAVGARGILVRTGYGRGEEDQPPADTRADLVTDNLIGGVTWILRSRS